MLVVAAALVDPAGRLLMQQRPAGREYAGLWEFPGGKVEPGETPIGALARELAEELAIVVAPEHFAPLGFASGAGTPGQGRAIVILLYGCRQWHGDPASQEGAQIAWCSPDVLRTLAMPPLDIPLAVDAARYALMTR